MILFHVLVSTEVQAQTQPPRLFISTNVPDATIEIDQGRRRRAPIRIPIQEYSQLVRISAPGYQDFVRRIPAASEFINVPENRVWNVVLQQQWADNASTDDSLKTGISAASRTDVASDIPVGNPFPSRSEWSEEDREILKQILTELRDMHREAKGRGHLDLAKKIEKSGKAVTRFAPPSERKLIERSLAGVGERKRLRGELSLSANDVRPLRGTRLKITHVGVDNRFAGNFVQILSAPADQDWNYDRRMKKNFKNAFGSEFQGFETNTEETNVRVCGAFRNQKLWQRILVSVSPESRKEVLRRLRDHFKDAFLVKNPVCIQIESNIDLRQPAYDAQAGSRRRGSQ